MPFGNEAKGLTLVYSYGCGEPTANLADAQIEMCYRVQLWNRLVDIEEQFRKNVKPLLETPLDEELRQMNAGINELDDAFRSQRADAAYRTIELHQARHFLNDTLQQLRRLLKEGDYSEPVKKRKFKAVPGMLFADFSSHLDVIRSIKELRAQLKPLAEQNKLLRKAQREKNAAAIKELETKRSAAVKLARQESKLYWGNYNDVIASYETARHSRGELRKKSPDGQGKITVQFITPMKPDEIFGNHGQFRLRPDSAQGGNWFVAQVRIRSYPEREPMWLELPVCLHRPLPEHCTVQNVSVIFTRVGTRWEHSLNITIRMPEPATAGRGKDKTVISFHASLQDDRSLHVATVKANGREEQVVIPRHTTSQFEKLDELRSKRDDFQNKAVEAIVAIKSSAPKWFQELARYADHWRKPDKLFRLFKEWQTNRFQGDEKAFDQAARFRKEYDYLYPWEFNLRQQIQRRRREQYRCLAARLVKQHDEIWLEEIPELEKTHVKTQNQALGTNQRYWRRIAARSNLRQILINAARKHGVQVKDASGKALFKTKKAARKAERVEESAALAA